MGRLPPSNVLLAIVRSPGGLNALVSQRRTGAPPSADQGSPASLYEVGNVAVGHLAARHRPAAELSNAWGRLAHAAPEGTLVLADILHVLIATVPSMVHTDRAPLRLVKAPPARQATAAHPRAFKGTRHRPPKRAALEARDLRGDLCVDTNTQRLLHALWSERGQATRRLLARGFDPLALRRVTARTAPPLDPYLLFHHDAISRTPLSPAFVERVLPSLQGATPAIVRRAAALHERLAMDAPGAALGARVLKGAGLDRGLRWWAVLESLAPERRRGFMTLVLETGASENDPAVVPLSTWIDLGHHAPAEQYERWTRVLLEGLARGHNVVYLATGIRFAAAHAPDVGFHHVGDAPDFDAAASTLLDRLLPTGWTGHDRMSLWATCGAIPTFTSYLHRTPWRTFSPQQVEHLLRFFMHLRWQGPADGAVTPLRWRAIRAWLPRVEKRLLEVHSDYVPQFLNDLGEVLAGMDTPKAIGDRLGIAIDLLARLNRSPFSENGNMAWPLSNLLKLPDPQRAQVLNADDTPFLRLDKACRRENDASLIAWGLSVLVERAPRLVAETFLAAPGTLFRTARHLGPLSWESRRELVTACVALPVFRHDLETRPLADLLGCIGDRAALAIPRALREHLAGTRHLTAMQVERHARVVRQQLPALRLAAIQAAVDARLAASVGVSSVPRDVLPALALLQTARANRRGLRRLLRAYVSGDADYLEQHPATRAWARRHPRIDVRLWTEGIERRFPGDDGGEITVRLEHDAIEVLKMGTYVGSCLGLGGGLSYSAAAALLDVNKQVLYARGRRGEVLARQLVAISDDDRLVCFQVYPASAPRRIRRVFEAYDEDLAAALKIDRLDVTATYSIENVLSQEWWDDYPWNPQDEGRRGPTAWTRASK